MSIFDVAEDVKQEEERDVIAGKKLPTDLYKMKIKLAYLDQSKNGAHCLTIVGVTGKAPNEVQYNETIYFTNRAGDNFYIDKKSGDKRMMPGFSNISNMCELLTGKKFGKMEMVDKTINVYNYDERKEMPVERKVLIELVGMIAHPAIYNIAENKQVKGVMKNGKEGYVNCPTGATVEKNEISKWFDLDKCTLPEKKADKPAKFYKDWLKSHQGKVKDKVEKMAGVTKGMPAVEDTAEDLFGDDD